MESTSLKTWNISKLVYFSKHNSILRHSIIMTMISKKFVVLFLCIFLQLHIGTSFILRRKVNRKLKIKTIHRIKLPYQLNQRNTMFEPRKVFLNPGSIRSIELNDRFLPPPYVSSLIAYIAKQNQHQKLRIRHKSFKNFIKTYKL